MLSINFSELIWTIINFFLLFFLLKRFLFDPVGRHLDERQAKIEGWKELTAEVMQSADSLLRAGDTAAAVARLGELPNRAFLDDMQRALVASLLPEPAADSAPADSSAK